jgi:hypothetical protein
MQFFRLSLIIITLIITSPLFAQNSERIQLTDKISVPAERNGCFWVSSSIIKRENPSDVLGFIIYGFRGLLGKNTVYTAHYNCPPIIDAINLDKNKIYTTASNTENYAENDSQKIKIQIAHSDAENDVVTYDYKVSYGKIIGQGANVTWDLSGALTGTYTITVCLDDGLGCELKGAKNKLTKEITVLDCPNCK